MAYTIMDKNFFNMSKVEFLIDETIFLYLKEKYVPGREYVVSGYCRYIKEIVKLLYKDKYVVIKPPYDITDNKEKFLFHLIRMGFYGVIIHQ